MSRFKSFLKKKNKKIRYLKLVAIASILGASCLLPMNATDCLSVDAQQDQTPEGQKLLRIDDLVNLPNIPFRVSSGNEISYVEDGQLIIKKCSSEGIQDVAVVDLTRDDLKPFRKGPNSLFDVRFIAPNFMKLRFGEERFRSLDRHFTLYAYHVLFDIQKSEFFTIPNNDFGYVSIDGYAEDPSQLVLNLIRYNIPGINNGHSKRVYFNLLTKTFGETIIDFSKEFLNCQMIDGKFIVKDSPEGVNFYKYKITDEKQLVVDASPHYTIPSQCDIDHLKGYIVYPKREGNLMVPKIVNLNAAKPVEQDVLTDHEKADLKYDVPSVSIIDGLIVYIVFGEKIIKCYKQLDIFPVGKFGLFIKRMIEKDPQNFSNFSSRFCMGTSDEVMHALDMFYDAGEEAGLFETRDPDILSTIPDAIDRNIVALFWQNQRAMLDFVKERMLSACIKYPCGKFMSATIPTADPNLHQVVRYIKSESTQPNGYFIIALHGLPHETILPKIEASFFLNREYSIVLPNIRGSIGFGKEFKEASDGNWYNVVDDIEEIVKWARETGIGQHPIIIGSNFGGYVAAACYAKGISHLVVSIDGIYDLNLFEKAINSYVADERRKEIGRTEEIRTQNNLINRLEEQQKGHMLVFSTSSDCEAEQSNALFEKMKELRNNIKLIKFNVDQSGCYTPLQIRVMYGLIEEFLGERTGHPYEQNGYAESLTGLGGTIRHSNAE
ncbi:MAG: hypothetical protein HEEMFOPI_00432 [Holosporales bacterium]